MAEKDNIKIPALLFGASDALDSDFCEYHSEKLKALHQIVREKKYTVKNTSVNYRNLNHWGDMGLLPDGVKNEGEGWRKFNLIEIIWIEMIKRIRDFGLSLESIKTIKKNVLDWDEEEKKYPWFEYFIIRAKSTPMDVYLATLPNGESALVPSRILERDKMIFGSRSLILISIKEILNQIGIKVEKPETLWCLSKEEKDIVYSIRDGRIKDINVKMRNGKISNIDTSESVSGEEINDIIKGIRKDEDFAQVITKFEKGKEQSMTVVKKKIY